MGVKVGPRGPVNAHLLLAIKMNPHNVGEELLVGCQVLKLNEMTTDDAF